MEGNMPEDFEQQLLNGLEEDSQDANTDVQPTEDVIPQEEQTEPQESEQVSQEIEIDGEKFTAEELKEALMLRNNYTQKMQEIAEYRKEKEKLEPILNAITSPDKYNKVMKALQEEEQSQQQSLAQQQTDIEAALNELDPDDPYAKTLQKALAEIEALKSQLSEYGSQYKQDAEYLRRKQIEEQQKQYQEFISEVKDYAAQGRKFESDVEKELYDIAFTASLANVPTEGITAQEYKEIARTIGDLVYKDIIQKFKDDVASRYRQTKQVGGEERLPEGQKPEPDLSDMDLQQKIETLLGG